MANDRPTETEYENDEERTDEFEVEEEGRREPDTVEEAEREYDEYGHGLEGEDSDWTDYLDEGTIAVLLIAGAFLFLVPEPVTSVTGLLLLAAGLGGLVIDALS